MQYLGPPKVLGESLRFTKTRDVTVIMSLGCASALMSNRECTRLSGLPEVLDEGVRLVPVLSSEASVVVASCMGKDCAVPEPNLKEFHIRV